MEENRLAGIRDTVGGEPPRQRRAGVPILILGAALLGAALAVILWRAGAASPPGALEPPRIAWTAGSPAVASIIRIECARFGVPADFALCVAVGESRLDPQAVGDDGDAVGLYQFHLGTWQHFRAHMGLPADDLRRDAREAARTACWAFANGFQRRWTVVRRGLCTPDPAP